MQLVWYKHMLMQIPSFNCTYFWSITQSEILVFFIKASPYVRFNKNGTLLAVSVDHNSVKILANDGGRILLQTSLDASTYLSTREVCISNLTFFIKIRKKIAMVYLFIVLYSLQAIP